MQPSHDLGFWPFPGNQVGSPITLYDLYPGRSPHWLPNLRIAASLRHCPSGRREAARLGQEHDRLTDITSLV